MMRPIVLSHLKAGGESSAALAAPGRLSLTYGQLRALVARTHRQLAARGIGPGDRAAIVLPNGPEMASCFLAIASGLSAAPLNPSYTKAEFDFYLSDLRPKLVLVEEGADSPVRQSALDLGIAVAELHVAEGDPAGAFTLWPEEAASTPPSHEHEALVLHTSGTTSRPKVVPLSQANLFASANSVATALALSPSDQCLNIMPLFHIHGLIGVLLSSISAGASVCCTPGFNALRFFTWVDETQPSWYSAVPTMHQAILQRAERNRELVARSKLRLIRSSSASLPPAVFNALHETFGCPIIEAYGMTEATHQMASNPLGPGKQKPGFVGRAAGPEIRILDARGRSLPAGVEGEVCIRGDNVTAGYDNNPEANAASFIDGWFRTGDQGFLDEDGYLKISGRIKEIINRGGEKISPLEVDDVLIEHPAISQVVTFGMPHKSLGEEVAVVVVLVEGQKLVLSDVQEFAAGRLAPFKIPRKLVVLDEIPKGATGKVQRIGLAKVLGLTETQA
ncbi:acyl-CoA synthetase (AMP-forming)/AMP-acid ligase II [Aminobacter aminovorans]|uniref:Acyl-CoA synthetase (AMP-forming)/AMP-acid ligase II n=3 Tax=Aminobacter aminovorans TaxID=83263 RepID=A0ABR6H2J3_AMIAI|nr:acyl--CoA ligase [Aminobacter aminovorans]MBB3704733.1 acyl-CoA synthetase (AMP-forming)/AMP-acid ligase II [Aminobacter aminovorans]